MTDPSETKLNLPKRVFAYLVDSFLISTLVILTLSVSRSAIAGSVCNLVGFLLRDAVTREGSPGKRLARLRVEASGQGLPARLNASALRNLPLALPLLFACFVSEPSTMEQALLSLTLFLALAIELWKLHRPGAVRFGDQLAGTRVLDLAPQDSKWRYAGLALAVIVLNFVLQILAARAMLPNAHP